MLSEVPAPHPWLGDKRFSDELPIEIENLPKIDAVIISHDHYDHLDYASILKLKDKVGAYFVPLGNCRHQPALVFILRLLDNFRAAGSLGHKL